MATPSLPSAAGHGEFSAGVKIVVMCPICACSTTAPFFTKSDRTLLICRDCRHVWWDRFPQPDELCDYYRRQYTQGHAQTDIQTAAREYYAGHLTDLLRRLGKRPKETSICDYGCSIPVLLIEAKRRGFREAVGVDYCEETKLYGAAHQVRVIAPQEVDRLPDASLDVLRFSHTLEHSLDPLQVLRSVLKKVQPGGLVYITQPSFPVFRFAASATDLKDTVYPEHLHFFSALSLLELVLRADLQVAQFFTHQNEEAVVAEFRPQIDLGYATSRLGIVQAKGEAAVHLLGNYPYYAGENSAVYAFK